MAARATRLGRDNLGVRGGDSTSLQPQSDTGGDQGDGLHHRQPRVTGQGVDRHRDPPQHRDPQEGHGEPRAPQGVGMAAPAQAQSVDGPEGPDGRGPGAVVVVGWGRPGGQADQAPRRTDHRQGGHHHGQDGELEGLDEFVAAGPGTERRDQARHQQDDREHEDDPPSGLVGFG